jgi:hypothetical protein
MALSVQQERGATVNSRGKAEQRADMSATTSVRKSRKSRKAKRASMGMGALGKMLAVLLAVNMAVMLALPIGIFADVDDNYATEYGQSDSTGNVSTAADANANVAADNANNATGATAADTTGGVATGDENYTVEYGDSYEAVTQESAPAQEQAAPSGGMNPMGITPMAVSDVSNWQDFWTAVNTPSIDVINIVADFRRSTTNTTLRTSNQGLPIINRNLTINGNNHKIHFGPNQAAFEFSSPSSAATVEVNNLRVERTGSANSTASIPVDSTPPFFLVTGANSNLTLNIKGVRYEGSGTIAAEGARSRMVTSASTAKVRIGGYDLGGGNWVPTEWKQTRQALSGGYGKSAVVVYCLEFIEGPTNLTMSSSVVRISQAIPQAYIKVSQGADVTLENLRIDDTSTVDVNYYFGQCVWFAGITSGNEFIVDGGKITGTSNAPALYGDQAGTFNFNGTPTGFKMEIKNGGEVHAYSTGRMAAFVSNVQNCTFDLKNEGSLLHAESKRAMIDGNSGVGYAGTLRFRALGNQTFNVTDNAELRVTKKFFQTGSVANTATWVAGIRFGTGIGNTFNVNTGGKVYVHNEGNGSTYDPGNVDADEGGFNSAIEFANRDFTFNVSDVGSIVSLTSEGGAAINCNYTGGKINISNGATFIARGKTASNNGAIFRVAGGNNTFDMDNPLYYDFRNDRNTGLIFDTGITSTFTSNNSDLSVWLKGMDHEASPYRSWIQLNYKLSGEDFGVIDPSSQYPNEFNTTTYGKMSNYSRMSANNSSAKVEGLHAATNADQYIRANAKMPEGRDGERGAWNDEVYAEIKVTPYDDTNNPYYIRAVSIDTDTDYDGSTIDGLVRFKVPDNGYLRTGDKYEITRAWRGNADFYDPDDPAQLPRIRFALDADIDKTPIIVTDATPPTPVEILSHAENNTEGNTPGVIWTDQRTISGSYTDMSSIAYNRETINNIYAAVNGVKVTGSDTGVPTGGTWTVTLPETMTWADGDTLSIVAVDTNGKENPIVDTSYHDATFGAAASLSVKEFPVELSHANKEIGLIEARSIRSDADTNARLKALVGADANVKAGMEDLWLQGTTVTVINDGGFKAETTAFNRNQWITDYGYNPKEYTITYQLNESPSHTGTATVKVFPEDEWNYGIGASPFNLSVNNATALVQKSDAEQADELITRADAKAYLSVDPYVGPYSRDNVEFVEHTIPNAPVAGQDYSVTFRMKFAPYNEITVAIHINQGNTPKLEVIPPTDHVWIGAAADKPADATMLADYNIMNGVTAWDVDGGSIITGVIITSAANITDPTAPGLTFIAGGRLQSPAEGIYRVVYSVTNSDNNTVTAQRVVIVGDFVRMKDYAVKAFDFVATLGEVNAATTLAARQELIKTQSWARAWRVTQASASEVVPVPVAVDIVDMGGFTNNLNNGNPYDIKLSAVAEAPYSTDGGFLLIKGRVIDKNVVARDSGPATATEHYVVAADNVLLTVTEATGYGGTNPSETVKAWLKDKAHAKAYKITGAESTDENFGIDVKSSTIPTGAIEPGDYKVVFTPTGLPDITCEVTFQIYGTPPVIDFDKTGGNYNSGAPLVFAQTPGVPHLLTEAEIKSKMTVTDLQDGNLIGAPGSYPALGSLVGTTFSNNAALIDTQSVGVHSVTYTVRDSDGMVFSATRAIVINDGRYVIDRGDLLNDNDGLIFGAKNFITKVSDVHGSSGAVRGAARAFAYHENGTSAGTPFITNWSTSGYVPGAAPGTYNFTFGIDGSTITKSVKGYIVSADELVPGGDDDQYAIAASKFTRNLAQAQAMVNTNNLPAAEITAATPLIPPNPVGTTMVYKLVDDAPSAHAYVASDHGFPGNPVRNGTWQISFGVQRDGDTIPYPLSLVTIDATVSQGTPPVMTVTTPLEVAQGSSTFDPKVGVAITDAEDGDPANGYAIDPANATVTYKSAPAGAILANGVNTAIPGIYAMEYRFVDIDNNPITAERVVVVNDGHYVVSGVGTTSAEAADGRVLYANTFVIDKSLVAAPAGRNDQIISKAQVKVYNGKTGAEIGNSGIVSVTENSSYGPTAGTYPVKIQALDVPGGVIVKDIIAQVVDATEIKTDNSTSSDLPNAFGPTTWVYGNNLPTSIAAAETIASHGIDGTGGVKQSLGVGATLAAANGVASNMAVNLTDTNNFISRLTGTDNSLKTGVFNFTATSADGLVSIPLTITVSNGFAPVLTVPKPQNFDIGQYAPGQLDGSGNLTPAAIMLNVEATDEEAKTPANPTGNITSFVTYRIYDVNGAEVFTIPGNVATVYKVVYTIEDDDHNPVSDSRALIINDGRFVSDPSYVLSARSFLINRSDVTPGDAQTQIRTYSEARAWQSNGNNATAVVNDPGGYPTVVDSIPIIGVSGGTLQKAITARIVENGTPGTPKDTDGNSDNGNGYSIEAYNFRINTVDAAALSAQATTNASAYAVALRDKARAKGYNRATDNLAQTGTVVLVSDGGFALSASPAQGDYFDITFAIEQDAEATVTIRAFVDNALPPTLTVPAPKYFEVGDTITAAKYMEGVSASDPEDGPIPASEISYDASAVDTSLTGFYSVIYSVTDKDHNTTTKQGLILVNQPDFGNYSVKAFSFVKLKGSVAGDNAEILAASYARAWRIYSSDPDEWPDLPIEVDPSVGPLVKGTNTYADAAGDYAIQLGVNPEPGYTDEGKTLPITGRVIEKNIISNDDKFKDENGAPLTSVTDQNTADARDTNRYVVAANNAEIRYSEVANYVGTSSTVIGRLMDKAEPVAYKMVANSATIDTGTVRVVANEIEAGAIKGDSFWVTFGYSGVDSVFVKVKFSVVEGNVPDIEFTTTPLVIEQTHADTPQLLPDTVLDDGVVVSDVEDLVTGYQTQLAIQPVNANNQPADAIDSNKIGVYRVRYIATDGDGNTTTKYRAVVIDDGRYIIADENNDSVNDIIIGARDFVVKQSDVVATQTAIASRSWAEAFDVEGVALTVSLMDTPPIPPTYTTGTASQGTYNFKWGVTGHSTLKPIVGTVVVADVVDSDGKDSQYSIVASNFQRNVDDARAIVATGDAAFIEAAHAQIYKLVADAPTKDVKIADYGGFVPSGAPSTWQTNAFNIVFTIDGISANLQKAPIVGTVSNRTPPVLEAPPLTVWVGDAADKPAGAIDPADYDIKYGVTASDVEDIELSVDDVVAEYVDVAVPSVIDKTSVGSYPATYSVTDSDNNTTPAERTILINDGRWETGEGRMLRANPFVIKFNDVATDTSLINSQLLVRTNAELRDIYTNASITSSDQLFIASLGTPPYAKAVGTYQVTVAGKDDPASSPDITKAVTAEVVDAEVMVTGPNDPNQQNYTIFGNNIVLTPAEAQAIVDASDKQAALLTALNAGARVSNPDGTLTTLDVALTDMDSFLSKTFVSGQTVLTGTYRISLADTDNNIAIPGPAGSYPDPLTVRVASGSSPVIHFGSAPLKIPISATAGTLTEAQLTDDVTATDLEDNAAGLTLTPTIEGPVPTIATDEFSVTKVTYTVTDEAGNTVTRPRAVIVDDGSITVGTNYMLRANSFVINREQVDTVTPNVQIMNLSEAQGWTIVGDAIDTTEISVADNSGYGTSQTVGEHGITIQVNNEPSTVRNIRAKIVNDTVIENADLYSIVGNHFRVNVRHANELVAKTDAEIAAEFMADNRASVKSYLRASSTFTNQAGTKVMTSDGGFKAHGPFTLQDQETTFPITFQVFEDDTATITVICTVSNAEGPDLSVPAVKLLPWKIAITDAQYREGVVASDTQDGTITSRVVYDASAVDINVAGYYPVTYSVTDDDDNTTTATGYIIVDDDTWRIDKDYGVHAYDFVATSDEVTAAGNNLDQLILGASFAEAVCFTTPSPGVVVPVPATAEVRNNGGLAPAEGTYPGIVIGVVAEAPYEGNPLMEIEAEVIDREYIDRGPEVGNTKYAIAADNAMIRYSEVSQFVGLSGPVKARLIDRANAEAREITDVINPYNVDVTVNNITAGAVLGDTFDVTFIPQGVPSESVTVQFRVFEGNEPIINFITAPLVIHQTNAALPQYVSDAVLRSELTVSDVEDQASGYPTQLVVQVVDQNNAPAASIDTNKIGVYRVQYKATDGDSNVAIKYRAVVIDDGRYIVDNDIILGARDFVVKQVDVVASQSAIGGLSYADAYDIEGTDLRGSLTLLGVPPIPVGYTTGTAEEGPYAFTWGVNGYSVQKLITGTVVDASYLDPGTKDSQYAIAASNFQRNVDDARAIVTGGDAAFITAARAQVYKLVDDAPTKSVHVQDRGGFVPSGAPSTWQTNTFTIVFTIDGINATVQNAPITATVSNRTPPELNVPAPLVVWVGAAADKPAGAIDPADYDILYGVTASDVEDTSLSVDDVVATYVDVPVPSTIDASAVGSYPATYSVTDLDNNTVTADRTILINDGRWVPGQGRMLRANPFVISLDDVPNTEFLLKQQLISFTNAELRDVRTNALIDSSDQLFIASLGTPPYQKAVGVYDVTVAGKDSPASNPDIQKTVKAEVVDAKVVVTEPNEPNQPNYSIFGNNIQLTPAEAQAIVDASNPQEALRARLNASARLSNPDGTLTSLDVALTDTDSFFSKTFVAGQTVSNTGTYRISVADTGNNITIPGGDYPDPLTVTVASGAVPVITALPAPLRIPLSATPGTLTQAQLMDGVSATDLEDNAAGLTLTPTIVGGVPTIAADEFSVTKVTYTVTDEAGNTATKSRAVIVDDGSVKPGINYILRAHSFVINQNNVAASNRSAQIIELSEAEGWTIVGDALTTTTAISVSDSGGYTNTEGEYRPVIQINSEPSLTTTIKAKVVKETVITNGELYSIDGNNFRVNVRQANELVAKTTSEIATEFMGRASVQSFLRASDMSYQAGTKSMTTDGGFKAHGTFTLQDQETTFPVTFWVDEDHTATITVICTISNAAGPDLSVPALKSLPLGVAITDAQYREGVLANDALDGPVATTAAVDYDASAVNINVSGYYPVNYWVVDSDDNRAEATGYILINDNTWIIDGDYAVRAYDFVVTSNEVTAAGANLNQLILGASFAEAICFTKPAPNTIVPEPVTPVVKANGNLSALKGSYSGIQIGVVAEAPYVGNPIRTISAEVTDHQIIDRGPEVGDVKYTIAANNATIRYSEVAQFVGLNDVVKARLIDRASAEARRISDAINVHDVDVTANAITAAATVGNTFNVTFIPKGIASESVTVTFTVTLGNDPVIAFDGPITMTATDVSTPVYKAELLADVTATDEEAKTADNPTGDISSAIEVYATGATHEPTIDASVAGVYSIDYVVFDSDGNEALRHRAVIVDDGRYHFVDEDGDDVFDYIIGAKSYVIKHNEILSSNILDATAQAKSRAHVEAYDFEGTDLSSQVDASNGLPVDYLSTDATVACKNHAITWALNGHPNVTETITALVIPNNYKVDEHANEKGSKYAVIARDFQVNTKTAKEILVGLLYHEADYADASVITLAGPYETRQADLVGTGGFTDATGNYTITFGTSATNPKVSRDIIGSVTDGTPPVISNNTPIVINWVPNSTGTVTVADIITAGNITILDAEDSAAGLTIDLVTIDNVTQGAPAFPLSSPAVHQIKLSAVDDDGNIVEKLVAVVVQDGNFVIEKGFILRAVDFDIDLAEVSASDPIKQISEQGDVNAWRVDGSSALASVSNTGGYHDAKGVYHPVISIYDNGSSTPSATIVSKGITATVFDNRYNYRVAFNANGGTLLGPSAITITEPRTTLPYLPASPIRDGYTFRYWSASPSGGTQFASDTTVTGNMTLYAIWAAIPPVPEPPAPTPTPAPNIYISNPPAATRGGGATYVTVAQPPEVLEEEPVVAEEIEEPVVPTTINTPEPPLAAADPGWSLLNLLATILAGLLLVVFFIKFFFDRPRDEEYEEEPIDAQLWEAMTPDQRAQYQARREADYQAWLAEQQRKVNRPRILFVNAPVVLIVAAAMVEGLIVLLMTQNFGAPMQAVDNYSVIFALILFVQLLAPMVAAILRNNKQNKKTPPAPTQPAPGTGTVTM